MTTATSPGAFPFAEAQQIGTVVQVYKNSTLKQSLLGLCLSVLGSAFVLVGVPVVVLAPTLHSFSTALYAAVFGLGLLGFGITQIRASSRNRSARISVGTGGLMRFKGDQAEAIRWDQIAAVQKSFTHLQNNYFLRSYVLLRHDGSVLTLEKSYRAFKALGQTIEDEVTRRLLPDAIAAYQAGSPVNFGAILVSDQGIRVQQPNGQKTLHWNEFSRMKVHDGRVMIKKNGARLAWETLLIPQVPNLCVLLALTLHITAGQKP